MLLFVGLDRVLGTIWRLKPGMSMTIGRKDSDFLIGGDHSVSRKHGTIRIDEMLSTELGSIPKVWLRDEGSKFGLFVNGKQISNRQEIKLSLEDKITFGAQGSTFQMRYYPIAICISSISSDPAVSIESIINSAKDTDIKIVDKVSDCTHLLIPKLKVTTKVLEALVGMRYIVCSDYINLVQSMPLSYNIRDPSADNVDEFIKSFDFLPAPVLPRVNSENPIDLGSVSWDPDPVRQNIFCSHLFVFIDPKQNEKYHRIIESAGGRAVYPHDYIDRILNINSINADDKKSAEKRTCDFISLARMATDRDSHQGSTGKMPLLTTYIVNPPEYSITPSKNDIMHSLLSSITKTLLIEPISESKISLAVLFKSSNVISKMPSNPKDEACIGSVSVISTSGTSSTVQSRSISSNTCKISHDDQTSAPNTTIQRRSRRNRMDNFWQNMLSTAYSDNKTKSVEGTASLEYASSSEKEDRSKDNPNVDDKYIKKVLETPIKDTGGAFGSHAGTDSIVQISQADSNQLIEQDLYELSQVQEVRMIQPRPRQRHNGVVNIPDRINFKHFKKTIHPYQVGPIE